MSASVVDLDIAKALPIERALLVFWCVENDTFGFRITLLDKAFTRRGVLSTIGSIYDPLGLLGPFILNGRKILQQITLENSCWDDELTPELYSSWEEWLKDLPKLQSLKIGRCYKPENFNTVAASLHSFSDASDYGYGQATYLLRQVSDQGEVHVSLVIGKSRVVPSKPTTIPRLELTAALVSAKITAMVKDELDIDGLSETYWVDSMIVLGYIQNDVRRFRTFVANRVKKIRNFSRKEQWTYVNTKDNPADDASRGLTVDDSDKVDRWFKGPKVLWEPNESVKFPNVDALVNEDDVKVYPAMVSSNLTKINCSDNSVLSVLEERVPDWMRQKRIIARVLMFIDKCRKLRSKEDNDLSVSDIQRAETRTIKMIRARSFRKEIAVLKSGSCKQISGAVERLSPVIDSSGVLRVGGRLQRATIINDQMKHPIILPKQGVMVKRIVEWYHKKIEHLGRTSTINELRQNGY